MGEPWSERLKRLAELTEPDWDSYGAEPIQPAAVEEARGLLIEFPGGYPFPLSWGGVQVDWQLNERESLEVECNPDGTFGYLWSTSRTSREADGLGREAAYALCREVLGAAAVRDGGTK